MTMEESGKVQHVSSKISLTDKGTSSLTSFNKFSSLSGNGEDDTIECNDVHIRVKMNNSNTTMDNVLQGPSCSTIDF